MHFLTPEMSTFKGSIGYINIKVRFENEGHKEIEIGKLPIFPVKAGGHGCGPNEIVAGTLFVQWHIEHILEIATNIL